MIWLNQTIEIYVLRYLFISCRAHFYAYAVPDALHMMPGLPGGPDDALGSAWLPVQTCSNHWQIEQGQLSTIHEEHVTHVSTLPDSDG